MLRPLYAAELGITWQADEHSDGFYIEDATESGSATQNETRNQ